jgi:hypothetical protein
MADFEDQLRLREIELKEREFDYRLASEAHRLAAEFSKIIVTNLIWINTAGLGSLPVIAAFIGIGDMPWSQKLPLLVPVGATFAGGLVAANLCALATYYNYSSLAAHATSICSHDLRQSHVTRLRGQNGGEAFEEHHPTSFRAAGRLSPPVQRTYRMSHGLGWMSFICFLVACYQLTTISRP